MKGPREFLAERAAWREYGTQLDGMDRDLDQMEAGGVEPGTPEYDEAWNDRMSFAANCYPDAPERDMTPPEAEAEPEQEPEAGL
jgi:hypothetical protein